MTQPQLQGSDYVDPLEGVDPERCGCRRTDTYASLCRFHWNESNARMELNHALRWAAHGPLKPDDPADRRVLDFFDHLCYWAAKGIGEAGTIGSIYNAAARRRRES